MWAGLGVPGTSPLSAPPNPVLSSLHMWTCKQFPQSRAEMRFWSHWLPQTQQASTLLCPPETRPFGSREDVQPTQGPGWSSGPIPSPLGGAAWESCGGEETRWVPREVRHLPQRQDPPPAVCLQMPVS